MQTYALIATAALLIGIWAIAAPLRAQIWRELVEKLQPSDAEFYDGTLPYARVLAPAFWLLLVWACLLTMLYAAGYLSPDTKAEAFTKYADALLLAEADVAARRAAVGFSGVTLAITVALSLTSFFWCAAAAWKKAGAYRVVVFFWSTAFLVFVLTVSHNATVSWAPFTSTLGELLLEHSAKGTDSSLAQYVPLMMFVLSSVVPSMLLAGATYLLQPMTLGWTAALLKKELQVLKGRLRELDQMLYIGALSLVFGTLQLSSGLSVPLVSMPKAAELKAQADLCKTIGPSTASGNVFFSAALKSPDSAADKQCQALPAEFIGLDAAEGLRELVRGITLCFGLSFSALLAAIYVPALIVLRNMIEKRQDLLVEVQPPGTKAEGEPLVVDPFSRIAAVFATLSPLLAGLVANILAGA